MEKLINYALQKDAISFTTELKSIMQNKLNNVKGTIPEVISDKVNQTIKNIGK